MRRIGLISDTHGHLDENVFKYFEECDEIWHAGDIGDLSVTDRLEAFRPLRAVYGNIDDAKARKQFPKIQRFMCENMDVMMIHIGGRPYVYAPEVSAMLKADTPKIFICGHSHILRVEYDKRLKMLYMNPGAAGIYGFHKVRTILRFSITADKIHDMEAIELGPRTNKLAKNDNPQSPEIDE